MKRKRKLQKERDKQIKLLNQIVKILLNSVYGKMVYNLYTDTDSIMTNPEETIKDYIEQDNAIIQDFFKKQEV